MVLAEISLAIGAVKAVGSAIESAKSLVEVAGQLDRVFSLADQVEQKPHTKGATESKIEHRLGKFEHHSTGEDTSFAGIAQEIVDAKALRNELYTLKIQLNNKWGPDTYDTIINTRKKRLEKQEKLEYEHRQLLHERKVARKKFWLEMLKVGGLVLFVSGAAYWIVINV